MSAHAKRMLMFFTILYVAGMVLGLAVFRSPNFSSAYLAKYKEDHERFHQILKNEAYVLHVERPALHPLTPELEADAAFVEEYEARPEYRAEHGRTLGYQWYFRVFNSLYFIALIVAAGRRPLLAYLDDQTATIREDIVSSQRNADDGTTKKAGAQAQLERWPEQERTIAEDSEKTVISEVAVIHEEFDNTRRQLGQTTEDRKSAEYWRVARTIEQELIEQSIAELKERYRRGLNVERLGEDVDQFVRTMEMLS